LAEKLSSIRVHGQGKDRYENIRLGINGRLDTLQAVVLLCKLEIFEDELQRRRNIAKLYSALLSQQGVPVEFPQVPAGSQSAWAQYSLRSAERQPLLDKLQKNGIPHAIYYPIPLHRQGMFHHLHYPKDCFAISEKISREIFSLPLHPYLTEKAVERIVSCIA
jgi:UDP-2-acetamido-2-deoxy-ribo-hexuluronate aminotransferase